MQPFLVKNLPAAYFAYVQILMFSLNVVLVYSHGIFIESLLVESLVVLLKSWDLVVLGSKLFLVGSC